MDDVDHRLIAALLADARTVGLSAPSVADRVARLERDGVITGYHAAVAPLAVGLGVSALVGVYQREEASADALVEALHAIPEVEDCWSVAGEEELVLRLRARDVDALEAALRTLRSTKGVSRTRTTVVLSTPWEGRFPLPASDG
jgi:Lrp/AsnC family leucine-responsive transcriptional regulator